MKFRNEISVNLILNAVALVCTIASLVMFLFTYKVAVFTLNRWTLSCTVFAMWLIVFLIANSVFRGDRPFWTIFAYILVVFLMTYGMLRFLQPCITPIGFAFGASDLNMGDTALNRVVAYMSVATTVLYLVAIVCTVVAAFFKSGRLVHPDGEVK